MNDIIKAISDFIFVEDKEQKADIIITVGGSHPQIAEKAAELYNKGLAPFILAGGGYSVKTGCFKGVRDKADVYNNEYKTECDFYTDVLLKNGVDEASIFKEDKSGNTRENADFAFDILNDLKIPMNKIIVVCKRFHARRCFMLFASVFKNSDILIIPADIKGSEFDITRENWFKTEYGINRVLGELSRCGTQIHATDIFTFNAR